MLASRRKHLWGLIGLLALASSVTDPARAAPPDCPQPRFTGKAPHEYYVRSNPIASTESTIKAGSRIYQGVAGSTGCDACHGKRGDGKGVLASQFDPRPRNFSCAATVNEVPDGQLFWIIRFGSPGTAMPPHPKLTDEQVWQLVLYLRHLAK